MANWLGKGADAQVAHQHAVVAGAVQTWLIGHDAVALLVVSVVVVAAFCKANEKTQNGMRNLGRCPGLGMPHNNALRPGLANKFEALDMQAGHPYRGI